MTGACADITSRKRGGGGAARERRAPARDVQPGGGRDRRRGARRPLPRHEPASSPRFSATAPTSCAALTFADITHPDDLADTTTAVGQLLAGSIPDYSIEKRYLRKDGSAVWSLTTVTLLADAAGEPQRFIGVIEDISARKQAEAALREETRILELLNETGKTLASKLDLQPLVQAVTDAATRAERRAVRRVLLQHDGRARRRVPALHAVRRAARGVRALRPAARDARCSARPSAANAPIRCRRRA